MSAERLGILEAGSLAIGDAWVEHVQRDLRIDCRAASGGWPGTLREARALTLAHFTNAGLTADELEHAARAAYGRARKRWLDHARG